MFRSSQKKKKNIHSRVIYKKKHWRPWWIKTVYFFSLKSKLESIRMEKQIRNWDVCLRERVAEADRPYSKSLVWQLALCVPRGLMLLNTHTAQPSHGHWCMTTGKGDNCSFYSPNMMTLRTNQLAICLFFCCWRKTKNWGGDFFVKETVLMTFGAVCKWC